MEQNVIKSGILHLGCVRKGGGKGKGNGPYHIESYSMTPSLALLLLLRSS